MNTAVKTSNATEDKPSELQEKRFNSWVSAKKMIVDKAFTHDDLIALVRAIDPKNDLNTFSMGFQTVTMETSGESRTVPAFSMNVYIPSLSCAQMLTYCIKGLPNNLPFKVAMTFDKVPDNPDALLLKIKSTEEIVPRGVNGMSYAINLEKFVRYSVFRSLANRLADAAIYQFDPSQPPKNPIFPSKLPVGGLENKAHRDQVVLAERVFIPQLKEVNAVVNSTLTTEDLMELKNAFMNGIMKAPAEMLKIAQAIPINEQKLEPSVSNAPKEQDADSRRWRRG